MGVKDVRCENEKRDYKSLEDVELIRLFINDDRRAFDEFYNRHYAGLVRFVMAYCRDISIAEDVVQDTFLKLLSFKVRLGLINNIKNYMYSIALNRCRDLKRINRDEMALSDSIKSDEPSEYGDSEKRIDKKVLEKTYDRLPEMQREVLLLRVKSGLSFKEISEILHISENSAKVNYFHAVTNLKRLLEGGRK